MQPGSFILELDTVAPTIEWGTTDYDAFNSTLHVALIADEPAVVAAYVVDQDGREWDADIFDGEIVVQMPLGYTFRYGKAYAITQDDVSNAAEWELTISVKRPVAVVSVRDVPPSMLKSDLSHYYTWPDVPRARRGPRY